MPTLPDPSLARPQTPTASVAKAQAGMADISLFVDPVKVRSGADPPPPRVCLGPPPSTHLPGAVILSVSVLHVCGLALAIQTFIF